MERLYILRILTVLVAIWNASLLAETTDPLDNDNVYEAVVGRHGHKLIFPKTSVDVIPSASTPVWLELFFAGPDRPSDLIVTLRLGGFRATYQNGVDVGLGAAWDPVGDTWRVRLPMHLLKYGGKKISFWNAIDKFRSNHRKLKMRITSGQRVSTATLRIGNLPPVEPPPEVIPPEEIPVIQPPVISGRSATLNFSADAGSEFVCSLNSAPFTACTSPVTYPTLVDGEHVFEVRWLENADDPEGGQIYTFIIDTTRPQVTYSMEPPEPLTYSETMTVSFLASEPTTALCSIDGGLAMPCDSGTFTWYGIIPGRHNAVITIGDMYGNTSFIDYTWLVESPP